MKYLYLLTTHTYHKPLLLCAGGRQLSVLNFEKGGQRKMSAWGDKDICLRRGLIMFLIKKRLRKIKHGFEGLISQFHVQL